MHSRCPNTSRINLSLQTAPRLEDLRTSCRSLYTLNRRTCFGPLPTPLTGPESRPHAAPLRTLKNALRGAKSFLDVGCGVGTMLYFAQSLNPLINAAGVEYRKEVAEVARQYGEIWQGDALRYKQYGRFDIIFMYRPFAEERDQLTLEDYVIKNMRRGALLISLMPCHHLLVEAHSLPRGVYKKT